MRVGPRPWLALGSLYGLLAVAFGAVGAHALSGKLTDSMMVVYRTAVEYQFYHALALVLVGLWALVRPSAGLHRVGACFAAGVVLFSGSLYAYSLAAWHPSVYLTPLGGLLFLLGWAQAFLIGLRVR